MCKRENGPFEVYIIRGRNLTENRIKGPFGDKEEDLNRKRNDWETVLIVISESMRKNKESTHMNFMSV